MYSDQKANSFINKIRKNSELECHHILSKIEDSKAQAMLDAEKEATAACNELIEKESSLLKKEVSSKIAGTEESLKKEFFLKHSEITGMVFEKARKRLIEFVHSEDYPLYLAKIADEINAHYPEAACTVYMKKDDNKYAVVITQIIKSATIDYTDSIKIGGIRVEYPTENIIFDSTLDSGFYTQIEEFSFADGLSVI